MEICHSNFIHSRYFAVVRVLLRVKRQVQFVNGARELLVKTPNMIASGMIKKSMRQRHVVEDHKSILVKNFDGRVEKAEVIPHDIPVDLAIITSGFSQIEPEVEELLAKTQSQTLYVVAFDQGRNSNRVYKHSTFALYPELREHPTSRIHSNSKALPGNSGGAVVNEHGMLVGVLIGGSSYQRDYTSCKH